MIGVHTMRHPTLALLVAIACPTVSAQSFLLESLHESASKYPAPEGLRKHLAAEEMAGLKRCIAEGKWGLARPEDFFAARQVRLGQPAERTYLVFPTTLCPAYFGNSAVPFWIVRDEGAQGYRTLRFSSAHTVRIKRTTSNGYRDLEEAVPDAEPVGEMVARVRFDGSRYVTVR